MEGAKIEFSDTVKIISIGIKETGKTSFFNRYVNNKFTEKYNPTFSTEVDKRWYEDKKRKLYPFELRELVCDKGKEDLFKSFLTMGAHGIIFLVDAKNPDSREK